MSVRRVIAFGLVLQARLFTLIKPWKQSYCLSCAWSFSNSPHLCVLQETKHGVKAVWGCGTHAEGVQEGKIDCRLPSEVFGGWLYMLEKPSLRSMIE